MGLVSARTRRFINGALWGLGFVGFIALGIYWNVTGEPATYPDAFSLYVVLPIVGAAACLLGILFEIIGLSEAPSKAI